MYTFPAGYFSRNGNEWYIHYCSISDNELFVRFSREEYCPPKFHFYQMYRNENVLTIMDKGI